MRAAPAYRYEELAGHIRGLVDSGALPPGARVPSVRELSRQRGASVSTVLHAYRLLEDRGVIEARPKSGFYVARGGTMALETPVASRPPTRAATVSVSDVVFELLEHAANPALVPLGCAIPSPRVLAADRLDRCLARAARQRGGEHNTYTTPKGEASLREQIALRSARVGQAVLPDDIVITTGCTEALALALKSVTRAGDAVAIESPTYFGLLQVLEALGLKALELPTDASSGVDLDALEAALSRGRVAACLLSSAFNNPLGCTVPEDKKRALLSLLSRYGRPLIEDDVYGDIHFGKVRPSPYMALEPEADIIYCSSFSKSLAPGYRVGWVAAGRHLRTVAEQKFAASLCCPVLPQVAIAEFLASGGFDRHLRRIRRMFEDNVDLGLRAVGRSFPPGTRVSRPEGGFVLWLELERPFDSRALLARAIEAGVCFAPGDVFSAAGNYAHCLRLSCGHHWDTRIEHGIASLGEMAGQQISEAET